MKKLNFKVKKAKMYKYINGIKKLGWYCRMLTNGKADYEDIIEMASSHTTIHEGELRLAMDLCLEAASKCLKKGQIVELGPLGKIYPSATGKWSEDPDELSLSDLKSKINYRASDDIMDAVGNAKFTWAGANDSDDEDDETPVDPDDQEPVDTSTGTIDTSTNTEPDGDDGLGG